MLNLQDSEIVEASFQQHNMAQLEREPDDSRYARSSKGQLTNKDLPRTEKRDKSSTVSFGVVFSVFVVVPYVLYVLGSSIIEIFAVVIFCSGLLADVLTTKAGFNRGYDDYNVFYNLSKNKSRIKQNSFLIGSFFFGFVRLWIMYYFWSNTTILLLVASLSLVGPLWNSVILAYPDNRRNYANRGLEIQRNDITP
jgi:hypothetical protein